MSSYKITIAVLLVAFTFTACNNTPKQAAYIPKDASIVIGINAKELSKKIAWNVLVGSELFDEMKKELPDTAVVSGLGDAGVDVLSTIYAFVKTDERFSNGVKMTAIIPLSDVKKWENYIHKTFPGIVIKATKNRKEAKLGDNIYAGWTNDMAIVMNTLSQYPTYNMMDSIATPVAKDEDVLPQEMEAAFNIDKGNTLLKDKRFAKLEEEGHDLTLWVNYDAIMSNMGSSMGSLTGGIAMSGKLWKNAAMATGIDFEKGKIAAAMNYYVAEELQQVYKEYGTPSADKEMVAMLPKHNLAFMAAMHLTPKALKATLEKMGMLGFMSLALTETGLTSDDVFEAFSGDMAIAANDFMLKKKTIAYEGMEPFTSTTPSVNYLFTAMIGDKAKMLKLINFAVSKDMLIPMGNNIWKLSDGVEDTTYIVTNEKYLVASNKLSAANGFLTGAFKTQEMPQPVKDEVVGKPMGMFADFQALLANIQYTKAEEKDSLMTVEIKQLAQNFVASGGDFKDGSFKYKMDFNFVNKKENSLIILMNFAAKMQKLNNQYQEAVPPTPTALMPDTTTVNY